MKRMFYFFGLWAAATALLMAGCTKEDVVDPVDVPDPLGRTVLVDGEQFAKALPKGATQVIFIYGDNAANSGTLLSLPGSERPVYGNLTGSTWIVSTAATTVYANADCSEMFSKEDGSQLTTVDFGKGFNTSEVTDMSEMFEGCATLESLDLSMFNTALVTDMDGMFYGCAVLESLDLSTFNTAKVTDMGGMFYGCAALESLDLSSFNTAKVTDMSEMFSDCTHMTDLNLYNFSMSGITNASQLKDLGHNLAGESGTCRIHSSVEVCAKMMMHGGLPGWVTFRWETH